MCVPSYSREHNTVGPHDIVGTTEDVAMRSAAAPEEAVLAVELGEPGGDVLPELKWPWPGAATGTWATAG